MEHTAVAVGGTSLGCRFPLLLFLTKLEQRLLVDSKMNEHIARDVGEYQTSYR